MCVCVCVCVCLCVCVCVCVHYDSSFCAFVFITSGNRYVKQCCGHNVISRLGLFLIFLCIPVNIYN